jgi:hypothetical protein
MIDTIIIYTRLKTTLAADLFHGGSFSIVGARRYARFWIDVGEDYEPRVTYWRQPLDADELPMELGDGFEEEIGDGGGLRLEFSVTKFPLDQVDSWLERKFGGLPRVQDWTVLRIDYTNQWELGAEITNYLDVFKQLRIGNAAPMVYGSGVMWKFSNRVVKFYDKSREQGTGRGLLRFEVSNHRQAVRYMCDAWFGCDRTVAQLTEPGRVLFVLAYFWEKLGLGSVAHYNSKSTEYLRVASVFGSRAPMAWWVLFMARGYGADAIKEEFVTRATYYKYKRELSQHGFLSTSDQEIELIEALHLDTLAVFSRNLLPKDSDKDRFVHTLCGVLPNVKLPTYLVERFDAAPSLA